MGVDPTFQDQLKGQSADGTHLESWRAAAEARKSDDAAAAPESSAWSGGALTARVKGDGVGTLPRWGQSAAPPVLGLLPLPPPSVGQAPGSPKGKEPPPPPPPLLPPVLVLPSGGQSKDAPMPPLLLLRVMYMPAPPPPPPDAPAVAAPGPQPVCPLCVCVRGVWMG